MTPDEACKAAHALLVKSGGASHPHPDRDALVQQAHALVQRWLPAPQLTPRKREPDTYCFRCGSPVPGGLFIGNSKHKGRGFSWVNADGMKSRNPDDGATREPHACVPVAGQMALAI